METPAHDHAADLETALDFVNTLELEHGVPTDHFSTTRDALDWLQERRLIHAEASTDPPPSDALDARTLRRVRRTRAALRELVDATYEARPPAADAVAEVNRALQSRATLQLVPSGEGVRIGHRHVGDPVDDALANLAQQVVREIVGGRPERLRACASDTCRYVFYDDSRTGRRRWCDMASCGNRAKAARHRARVKGDAPGDPGSSSVGAIPG
jgi:predicted RNA-binding Zn ribbon-like protein